MPELAVELLCNQTFHGNNSIMAGLQAWRLAPRRYHSLAGHTLRARTSRARRKIRIARETRPATSASEAWTMVAKKGIPSDMTSLQWRCDGAATALRRLRCRCDGAATSLRCRCDGAATSLRCRCDGAATSPRWRCDVAPMYNMRMCIKISTGHAFTEEGRKDCHS